MTLPFLGEGDRNYDLWLELQRNGIGDTTPWITPPLNSPWAASVVPLRYRKLNGVVYMQGILNTLGTSGTVIFTLPEGFRPVVPLRLVGHTGSSTAAATVNVNTDGKVDAFYSAGTSISMANVVFPIVSGEPAP